MVAVTVYIIPFITVGAVPLTWLMVPPSFADSASCKKDGNVGLILHCSGVEVGPEKLGASDSSRLAVVSCQSGWMYWNGAGPIVRRSSVQVLLPAFLSPSPIFHDDPLCVAISHWSPCE